jgi:NAD(P)H-dependent flavin oxidoreductase YrpB (nitropropane dioxygenase family)
MGGMTGVGTPELAAKMSEAGGLGVFAIHNAGGATDEEMIENGADRRGQGGHCASPLAHK